MSASQSFDEFVRRQQPREVVDARFYADQKREWLAHLQHLHDQVHLYLKPYIDNGSILLDTSPVDLNEEGLGSYVAERLNITIGSQEVTLMPIGTMLIGTKGRVDVQGSRGKARLTLIDKNVNDARQLIKVNVQVVRPEQKALTPEPAKPPGQIDWAWKLVSAPPNTTFIDLNKDSFLAMIQEVSGG